MKILIACEYSGQIRDSFARFGHDVLSCDFLPTEREGKHYQGDVRDILYSQKWDLMVAHPSCTHLATSGARHFWRKEKEQKEALDFNNRNNDGDSFLVKKTSPGFYSMFDVIIEDKKESEIYGVIIIKLKSINIGFHSIRNKLNRMKLKLSKNVSKVIIIADYNPKNDDDIKIIEKHENNLKTRGFENIKTLSITQVDEIFPDPLRRLKKSMLLK